MYLNNRILPMRSEEVFMRGIPINLVNALENEMEVIIRNEVKLNPSKKGSKLLKEIDEGFSSFKSKFEWLFRKNLISREEREIMDELRILRNRLTHYHRSKERPKYKYRDFPLLTIESIKNIFLDCNSLLVHLKKLSGSKIKWNILPPGYAEEFHWDSTIVVSKK